MEVVKAENHRKSQKAGEAKPRAPGSHQQLLWGFGSTGRTHGAHPAASRGAQTPPKQNPTRGLQKKELLPPQARNQQTPVAALPNQGYNGLAKQSPPAFGLPALLGACPGCQQRLGVATSEGRSQPRGKGQQRSPRCSSCRGREGENQPQPCSYL